MANFDQSWHCLRDLVIQNDVLTTVALDLPQIKNAKSPCHVRFRLEQVQQNYSRPHWVFQVPESVIKDHNDIFNAQARLLMMGLMQVSGAVMSLAKDWTDSIEMEEGSCVLDR